MLVNKPTEPDIRVFKVATGEELIATVVRETSNEYVIKQPLCMVPTQKGLQFAPFMMMADHEKEMPLYKPVIASAPPVAELLAQYESVTTGIALPQKGKIIT